VGVREKTVAIVTAGAMMHGNMVRQREAVKHRKHKGPRNIHNPPHE
jgi:hypothetical protein